ncbi:hypothetical protein [Streptomyces himalayensis]|uniref:Uncharacterized protein n=1 Tax=Streptomyces himalayensis subsp. himalayensis TaxID=2756131 RepID=A0A7W0DSG4_9ACTN|nr:hypothetical protein [Streptomyces himalayensis]MBA2950442.1 hypothetical protein [Streptomyces himalayensis subsp. himalayensis]
MDLESIADELYGLHPTQFVEARAIRGAEARRAGKAKLAAEIAALRRPTLSAWASNLLVRSEPVQVARLLRLGEGLRQAHQDLARERLKRLSRQQHTLVGVLSRQARTLAAEAGHPIGEAAQRKIEQTLHTVLTDPAAAQEWASGRLVNALVAPVGFTAAAVADVPVRPALTAHSARRRKTPPGPDLHVISPKTAREKRLEDDRRRKLAQANREAEAAEQHARRREEEHQKAQADVERAEASLHELEERATELARQLHATAELRRRVRTELDNARHRATQTAPAARHARRAAQTALARLERLET